MQTWYSFLNITLLYALNTLSATDWFLYNEKIDRKCVKILIFSEEMLNTNK